MQVHTGKPTSPATANRLPLSVRSQSAGDIRQMRALSDDEVHFEIDMCIGCDRCMRVCPVPLSAQVDMAALNRATISDDVAPQIARFANECVLCGSCVPVCPVDNHRDLLMLALKKRVGTPWDGQVELAPLMEALPAGWNLPLLVSSLREQPMFQDERLVPDTYLLHFCTASTLRVVATDTELLREGEFGREVYFILSGSCELFSYDVDGNALPLAILHRGDYVGEQGMLTGQPRNCTVRACEPAVVLSVPEQVMLHMLETVPALERFFVQYNTARAAEEIFKRLDLLKDIAQEDLHWLAGRATIRAYERGERLFDERSEPTVAQGNLHVLLDGFVKVARRTGRAEQPERVIAYRQRGDYFTSGMDMFGGQGAVSATAINRVTAAEISHSQLKSLLKAYPAFLERLKERLRVYREASTAAYSGVFEPFDPLQLAARDSSPINVFSVAEARSGLHALVSDGVVEGTDVLVIDLDRCIHCDECVDACERRHGHSRMHREGMVVGNISVVNACRQCQDPVCMLCSRAGIARSPSGEIYITESCIGCGICAERCPYDNISIVTLDDETSTTAGSAAPTWQRFSRFFGKQSQTAQATHAGEVRGFTSPSGRKVLPLLQTRPQPGPILPACATLDDNDPVSAIRKKIAVKCDLCVGYNNQACVQACPTGAAIRVNPVTFFGSTEEILGRRAR
ncbi:cyclic nucleotide-binding domain-containing protein [Ktedonobacteria bacterium brp13]|nr:cyclic nucleotide-binding domain-containing protein [Ktedonobacteria bacterium brp13]